MSAEVERRVVAMELVVELGELGRDGTMLMSFGRKVAAERRISPATMQRLVAIAREVKASAELENVASPETPDHGGPDRPGRAGSHPQRSGRLVDWALQQSASAGKMLRRAGSRGQTYHDTHGRDVHIRTMRRYDRGEGRYSYWFGIAEELWRPGGVFMLVCDTDAVLVVPTDEWLSLKSAIASAKGGTERQPNVWRVDGRYELRASGEHFDVTEWAGRFDLL